MNPRPDPVNLISCEIDLSKYASKLMMAPHPKPPPRSALSIIVLLLLVLAITAQLITGFSLWAQPGHGLLAAHVGGGVAAILLTGIEWGWLVGSVAGRHRLHGFSAPGSGMAEWSEAAFLLLATITVIFGALLATVLYLQLPLPFAALLGIHRTLAVMVAVLYLVHSGFAVRRARRRRT